MVTRMQVFRDFVLAIDAWTSVPIRLKTPLYTTDPVNLDSGSGIYGAHEWSATREKGDGTYGTDGRQYDTDDKYLQYAFGLEGYRIISAILLANSYNFGEIGHVLELGCGDMVQSLVLKKRFPHLHYVASDFDPYVIERCSQLRTLDGIEKRVLDVLKISDKETPFSDADLLMSWGLDYALDDEQFVNLLISIKRADVPYLMCSPTVAGPLKHGIHYIRKILKSERLVEQKRLRMHGFLRTAGYFLSLANRAGMKTRVIGPRGSYFCILFTS